MSFLRPPRGYISSQAPSPAPSVAAAVTASLKQSFSGSETDVSTSNENLSNEEKYVIRHTARQEPQGQENLQSPSSNRNSLRDSCSNRSSLDVSSSSYNTLIIHGIGDESWAGRNSGPRDLENSMTGSYINHQSSLSDPKKNSPSPSPSASSGKDLLLHYNDSSIMPNVANVHEITAIPDDYLNQSSVLKHLAKEVKGPLSVEMMDDIYRNPNVKYSYLRGKKQPINDQGKQKKKYSMSKSQPDLSKIGLDKVEELPVFKRDTSVPRPKTKGREESIEREGDHWPSLEMVEILIKENSVLKSKLEQYYQRVAKTQQLEQEVFKIHRSHEELEQSCSRREQLEKAARIRLQSDCRRLQEVNKALRDQLDLSSNNENIKREFNKREILISQLMSQNKELVAAKERHEIELAAQRATLQEQRTHIDILESALTNAQGNVVRLEEESRKKQVYVDRVIQLQRALSSLQLASERREQSERQLRQQLEMELERTKSGSRDAESKGGGWDVIVATNENNAELKKKLREREERIMILQGDCSKWEQRYLEESALRQAAIDAASIPKDAKIAALEKTSQETDKIIAEARNEKIRHMDEAHAAQKKVADLESRLKDLESKLAERDAMIRVLHKHTYDKDVSSMLNRSPHHTPHPSLASSELDHVLGAGVSREELVSSVLTSSTSFGSGNSYTGSDSSYMPSYKYESKCFDSTKKTLDNQIKEIDNQLDSQLLSKRALCCFPGFANPVSAPRKGTIPKPLLAGVKAPQAAVPSANGTGIFGTSPGSRAGGGGESGEMLLLEKQGRSSQRQRMQDNMSETEATGVNSADNHPENLPPSSLPRPPRSSHRSANTTRRLGEYNRLPDTEIPRKKSSDGGSSSNNSSRRGSPARSLIPPPRKLGDYGRLSESGGSGGSTASLRKTPTASTPPLAASRLRNGSNERDSATYSDNSSGSLPHPSKVRFYSGTGAAAMRRGSSLGRESTKSVDSSQSTTKFRIQF